jgi:hypothetical protein
MTEEMENLDSAIQELYRIKEDYAVENLEWYRNHRKLPGLLFRLAGIVIIALSLSIPFLSAARGRYLSTGVPIASLIIAIVTALNSFFAWQPTWEKRVRGQHTLEGLIAVWETKMVDSSQSLDSEERYRKAINATEELVDATRVLIETGTNTFFKSIKFPEITDRLAGPVGQNSSKV